MTATQAPIPVDVYCQQQARFGKDRGREGESRRTHGLLAPQPISNQGNVGHDARKPSHTVEAGYQERPVAREANLLEQLGLIDADDGRAAHVVEDVDEDAQPHPLAGRGGGEAVLPAGLPRGRLGDDLLVHLGELAGDVVLAHLAVDAHHDFGVACQGQNKTNKP
jgi:hypothetical protein